MLRTREIEPGLGIWEKEGGSEEGGSESEEKCGIERWGLEEPWCMPPWEVESYRRGKRV
jgi:hypothetical protein